MVRFPRYAAAWCAAVVAASAAESYPVGGVTGWPATWTPIVGLNDLNDAVRARLDFVGDANTPVAYWAMDSVAVYFRMRVLAPDAAAQTYSDSVVLMIDRVGFGNAGPDFGFSWDSKSVDQVNHGLEMSVMSTGTLGLSWDKTKFADNDGSGGGAKGVNDINYPGRADGFVRVVDGQPGGVFGTTSFIDFKVTWDYLTNYSGTGLAQGQQWLISMASIDNATDHAFLAQDVIGALADSPSSAGSWSSPITTVVPEPAAYPAAGIGIAVLARGLRRRRAG